MSFTEINHYVPQWYQRRFLPTNLKEQKFYYLDLTPDNVYHADGSFHHRKECRRLGPVSCFAQPHLYTQFFGSNTTDVIEKRFFGSIDRFGARAVEFFANYALNNETETALNNLMRYMDAQKLRTPKGLDYIKQMLGDGSHQAALQLMEQLWQMHVTIWMEGVWEILECDQSDTKFILSDHPVTTYNKKLFPRSRQCQYPLDAPIELVGTHTIFPLDLNRCLVITNLGYVRNPRINPLRKRENPRYFAPTLFDIRKVQTGRPIPEHYVQAINFIIRSRARRYVAAAQKEWLDPEKFLKTTMWDKLGDKFFLMPDPRKVPFTTGFFGLRKDGTRWASDEYGRFPQDNDPNVKAMRDKERREFEKAKKAWDDQFGKFSVEERARYLFV
jgi:hypothetical protein